MSVIAVDIIRREPYADGQEFGDTGPYERLDGVLTLAVDPHHAANRCITDLHLAPRDTNTPDAGTGQSPSAGGYRQSWPQAWDRQL
jgi:hypothetical protein